MLLTYKIRGVSEKLSRRKRARMGSSTRKENFIELLVGSTFFRMTKPLATKSSGGYVSCSKESTKNVTLNKKIVELLR